MEYTGWGGGKGKAGAGARTRKMAYQYYLHAPPMQKSSLLPLYDITITSTSLCSLSSRRASLLCLHMMVGFATLQPPPTPLCFTLHNEQNHTQKSQRRYSGSPSLLILHFDLKRPGNFVL